MHKRKRYKVCHWLTAKWNKIISSVMLAFIFTLNTLAMLGCSSKHVIDSPIFHKRPPYQQIIIERPPARIVYTGVVTSEAANFTTDCLKEMSKHPFRSYHFNERFISEVSIRSCSDERLNHNASFNSSIKVKR